MSKIVDTVTLKRMLRNARNAMMNRQLDKRVERKLDDKGMHVLSCPFVHNDVENIRCGLVMLKMRGKDDPLETVLDFTFNDWNKIPEHVSA